MTRNPETDRRSQVHDQLFLAAGSGFREADAMTRYAGVRFPVRCVVILISLLVAGCSYPGTSYPGGRVVSSEGTTQDGQSATSLSSSQTSPPAKQITFEQYTYEISADKVIRQVDNVAPGYAIPRPSFRIALVNPVDRGAKLFIDFNSHFRLAYRRTILQGVLNLSGTPSYTSSCDDISVLPGFCAYRLLNAPSGNIVEGDAYSAALTDASGANIQNSYAWITASKPIYVQFLVHFAVREGYQPSDFALLYLGSPPTVETLVVVPE
jgi:hypothetical protein